MIYDNFFVRSIVHDQIFFKVRRSSINVFNKGMEKKREKKGEKK